MLKHLRLKNVDYIQRMKVAVFNGFQFHYELFGCLMEYAKERNIELALFSECVNALGWFDTYSNHFGVSYAIHPPRAYRPSEFEYTILPTDDDKKFKRSWTGTKLIVFEHMKSRYMPYACAHARISMRDFGRADEWMVPLWKIPARPKPSQLTVVAVGNNCPSHPDELRVLFPNYEQIRFVLINRRPAPNTLDSIHWSSCPNVTLRENIDACSMLDEAASAHWLLFLPKNAHQLTDATSAIVALAYGARVPLLAASEYVESYRLDGMVALNSEVPLDFPSESVRAAVEAQSQALIERRNRVLDGVLQG